MNRGERLKSAAVTASTWVGVTFVTPLLAVEPATIELGPVHFTPTVGVESAYVDNVLRSDVNEVNSWVFALTPKLQAWLQNGHNTYSLSYQLRDSVYSGSSEDDFTDDQFNLDIHHEFNARNILNVFGEFYDGHEERGTGLSEGDTALLIDRPVEYERGTLGGDYVFGSRESQGRLKLSAKSEDYDYQNFRTFTQFRDRDQDTLGATLFWKVSPRTDVLLEVRTIENTYQVTDSSDTAGSLDSDELNYLVGVSWETTAKTRSTIKIGQYSRQYDSSARGDDDGFQWEVDLNYKLRSYSIVNLQTRRFSQETNGLGDFINTKEALLGWEHDWSRRSSTRMSFLLAQDDYAGASRADDRSEVEASFHYAVKRWLDTGFGYKREKRDSDIRSLDYSRNVYFIEFELSL